MGLQVRVFKGCLMATASKVQNSVSTNGFSGYAFLRVLLKQCIYYIDIPHEEWPSHLPSDGIGEKPFDL